MQTADKEAQALADKSKTITFTVHDEKEAEMKRTLCTIYEALREKGYNPINQIVGYILSEDPTYITNYKNARSLIRRIDRDELLNALVRSYLGI
ncbi:MAG: IreB family regulatory phosphoprotein [Clostridiales bacterium]|nr:IreB family regulatory phosphoprotein [Clostridiales bacterium]